MVDVGGVERRSSGGSVEGALGRSGEGSSSGRLLCVKGGGVN